METFLICLFDGSSDITITGTIGANSVDLGTDTVGNYVATVADAGSGNITVSGSGSETAAVTIDLADTEFLLTHTVLQPDSCCFC